MALAPLCGHSAHKTYTDGSGVRITGELRTAYGVHCPVAKEMDLSAPLLGLAHSVQRAELMAVCKAVEMSTHPLAIVTDSQYVVRTFRRLQRTQHCPRKHGGLWQYLLQHIKHVASMQWIKSHIPDAQQAM